MRSTAAAERGATLPIVALLLPVLLLMTGFAVDLGRQRSDRRAAQAVADVVALDMVRVIDGRALATVEADAATLDALEASAARNGALVDLLDTLPTSPTTRITDLEWGTLSALDNHFQPLDPLTQGAVVPTAVRVTAEGTTDHFFQPGSGHVRRRAVGTLDDEALAGFSIGSFAAAISPTQAGLLNSLVTPILGNPVGLTALGYQGLAVAKVGLGDLGAELGLLTPDEVLTTEVGVDDVLLAAATVLQRDGDTANAALLQSMATSQTQLLSPITLGDVVAAEAGGEQEALASDVSVLDLVTTAAFASRCTDPADLSTCSGLDIPSLSLAVPLLSTAGSLQLVQGQSTAYGPVGAVARTSQSHIDLTTVFGAQAVGTCTVSVIPLRTCLVAGLLFTTVDAKVTVDADIRLVDADGTIAAIDCGTPLGLDIATRTGAYDMTLDVTVEFGRRGVLGGLLGPSLGSLQLRFTTDQDDVGDLEAFDVPPDVLGSTVRPTGTGDIGLSGFTMSPVGGTGVLGTLGTLGINLTQAQVLTNLVNPLLAGLDAQLLGPLSSLLGVNIVGADLSPLAIDCENTTVLLAG